MELDPNLSGPLGAGRFSAWPDRRQELLLRAALLEGEQAVEAWDQWIREVELDFDAIDWGSKRLLAVTYQNLATCGVEHPFMTVMKERKQKTWLENQLLFHQSEPVIGALREAGIPTMLTKGAALVLRHYRDPGLRPMADLDLVVPTSRADDAMKTLEASGFNLMPEHAQLKDLSRLHAVTFVTDIGRQLDLHRHVIGGCMDDSPFWDHAVPVVLGGTKTLAPSPAELLLHICVHGVRANPVPPIRWIVDSAAIIRDGEVDWSRLVCVAKRLRFGYRMYSALDFLRRFDIPVPSSTIKQLSSGDRTGMQKREFGRVTASRDKSVGTQIAIAWLGFERFSSGETGFRRARRLPEYLRSLWGTDNNLKLTLVAIQKASKRIFRTAHKTRT